MHALLLSFQDFVRVRAKFRVRVRVRDCVEVRVAVLLSSSEFSRTD